MATAREKRQAFQQILRGPGWEMAPSAYDAFGTRLIERAGFKLIHMSGSAVHRSYGFGDVGLLSLTEQAARAAMMADSVDIPVIGDCETGHGNAVNVVRAVREFERSGVAAIHIEDQMTPKRPAHEGLEAAFISKEEFVGKIKAAVDTRTDESFAIIARIDSHQVEPYERTLERGYASAEAGADAIWIGGGMTTDEIADVVKRMPKPMVGIPRRPQMTAQMYGGMGYKAALIPGALAMAACLGMAGVLRALKEEGAETTYFASLPGIDEVRTWFNSIGVDHVRDIEERYFKPAAAPTP